MRKLSLPFEIIYENCDFSRCQERTQCAIQGETIIFSFFHPAGKAGGSQSQGAKGEVVALYYDPLATLDLASSSFPGRVQNEKIIVTYWTAHLVSSGTLD